MFRHPHLVNLPRNVQVPPPYDGGEDLGGGSTNLSNISQVSLSGHSQNLPSNHSSTTSNPSGNSTTSVAPMAPAQTVCTPSAPTVPTEAPSHTCTRPSHTCTNFTDNSKQKGSSTSPTPPHFNVRITTGKSPKLCNSTQVSPKEAYITVVEEACS